jgi:hypothetical protein
VQIGQANSSGEHPGLQSRLSALTKSPALRGVGAVVWPAGQARLGDHVGEDLDTVADGAFVERRVAEDQPRTPCVRDPVWRQPVQGDPAPGGRIDERRLVEVAGQVGDQVQAGGDPRRLEVGRSFPEGADQRVSRRQ